MSYSVAWATTGVITIPVEDLVHVSGTRYNLIMSDFHKEIRRLEWAKGEGLWAPQILAHDNTRYDFAGDNYAPFDEVLDPYTVAFGPGPTRVDLIGSNNNIIDVLVVNGVSVVPHNSVGHSIVETPAEVTAAEIAQEIVSTNWDEP